MRAALKPSSFFIVFYGLMELFVGINKLFLTFPSHTFLKWVEG